MISELQDLDSIVNDKQCYLTEVIKKIKETENTILQMDPTID
jgi:hypothetical protein